MVRRMLTPERKKDLIQSTLIAVAGIMLALLFLHEMIGDPGAVG